MNRAEHPGNNAEVRKAESDPNRETIDLFATAIDRRTRCGRTEQSPEPDRTRQSPDPDGNAPQGETPKNGLHPESPHPTPSTKKGDP